MSYEKLKEQALAITSYLETSNGYPECFGITSGNHDDMGISWGAVQYNIGSGTLQPIFRRLYNNHLERMKEMLDYATDPSYSNAIYDMAFNKTNAEGVAWGDSITDYVADPQGHKVKEPWNGYFYTIGTSAEGIEEQKNEMQRYYDLADAWFDEFSFWSRRAYALLFDIAVQSGGMSTEGKNAMFTRFGELDTTNMTKEEIETEKMRIVVEEQVRTKVSDTYKTMYTDRKMSIANGSGWVYGGTLWMDTNEYDMTLVEAFPENRANVRVYIDAGYGGSDTGGSFPDGTLGKHVTLDLAFKLRNILMTRYTGVEVLLSRTTHEENPTLLERANEARDWGATYVISLRLNSNDADPTMRGFKSLAVNNFTDPPASVFYYQKVIHDKIQEIINWSTDHGRGYINDDLVDNLDVMHIVTLNGFITNVDDQTALLDDAFRMDLAEAHAKGLLEAFSANGMGEAWESVDKTKHVFGIDVSSYQNYWGWASDGVTKVYYDIDWTKVVNQGTKFVYVRAVGSAHGVLVNGRFQESTTDTSLKQDPAFKQNCLKARQAGLPVGAYYFAYPKDELDIDTLQTAIDQANHFCDILEETFGPKKWGDLYPMLDFEAHAEMANLSANYIEKWIAKFKEVFEARIPTKLALYTGWYYLKEKNGFNGATNPQIANMPLWIANYSYNDDPFNNQMAKVGTWDYWTIWQYASDPVDRSAWGIATDSLDTNYAQHLSYLRSPKKVQNLRIDYIDNKLRLTWDKTDDADIVRYEVKKDGVLLPTVSASRNYIIDADVVTDRTYTYTVQAIDSLGEMSISDPITTTVEDQNVKNAPNPPTNVVATAGYESVLLSWTASDEANINGYNIYQDGKWIKWVDGTVTSYEVTGLINDVTYSYQLDASSPDYPNISVKTTAVSATPFIPIEAPSLPKNVKASVQKNQDVILTWEAEPKLSFSHFAIAINGQIQYNNLQDPTFTLTNMPTNVQTIVNVITYNIEGDQAWSANAYFTILLPSSPRDLVATPNDKEIALSWTANTETFISKYNLYLNGELHDSTTGTSYTFTTHNGSPLINGSTYTLGVTAVSSQSEIESTLETTSSIPIRIFPNNPTYVNVEVLAENEVKISWQYTPKERFSHFAIGLNGQIVQNNITEQFFNVVQEFPVRKEQIINVIAYDTDGDSAWSANAYFRIDKPTVPLGLNVKVLDRKLEASWFPNDELFVTGYDVLVNGVLYGTTDKTSMLITGLTNDTLYDVQIKANGKQFDSELTGIVSGTPLLDLPNVPRIIDYNVLGTGEVELIVEHTQKVDHSHYELYLDGSIEPVDSSEFKSLVTPTLTANQEYSCTVQAFDLDGDASGISEPFPVYFSSETLDYIQDNTLALGEIDETAKPARPTIFLCMPNKQTIGVISELQELTYTVRLGDLNEVNFTVPFMVDRGDGLIENPLIEQLRERFIVRIELNNTKEYFLINTISDQTSSDGETRTIHAYSLGYELSNYEVRSYEKTGYAKEVLEEILSETPWQLATSLKDVNSFFNRHADEDGSGGRTFEISKSTVLEFVKEVASAFGAVLDWNTETRSIDFVRPEDVGENKGFRISYDKYLKSMSKEVNGDEMVTRLYPIGENNLTIREVNPTQSPYIEDFSFFLYPFERDVNGNVIQSSNYMSDELAGAILDYQQKLENYDGNYKELYQQLQTLNGEKTSIQNELNALELQRDIVQGSVDRLKVQDALEYNDFTYSATPYEITKEVQGSEFWTAIVKVSDVTDFAITFQGQPTTLVTNEWVVLGKVSGTEKLITKFSGSNPNVYVEMYYLEITSDEYSTADNEQEIKEKHLLELSQEKVEIKADELSAKQSEIDTVNQSIRDITFELSLAQNFTDAQLEERKLFVVTREYENSNIANAEELYNEALKEFKKIRTPQVQINIDIMNFLGLVQAQNDWDKLEIGDIVQVFDERLKVDYSAKILEINFDYDNNNISLKIASADEIKTDQEKFMDSLYKAVSTSNTVDLRKHEWDKVSENSREIQSWLESEFDATKKKIIGGTNESIEISKRGLLIKDKNDHENFLVAQHKVIAITNDGGKTYKNAITTEGVIGERLIGKIIAGENLIIENQNGSVRIDRDGLLVKGFALRIEGGIDERTLGIDTSGLRTSYEDWNKGNNTNDTTPATPVVHVDGTAVDHIDRADDTVDISFSWDYDTNQVEGDIDGFMVFIHTSSVNASYDFGTSPSREVQFMVNPLKRSVILKNVSKYLYYTFGVQAYRVVDKTINANELLTSPIVKAVLREENPYYPLIRVQSSGTIYSTVDGDTATELNSIALNVIRQGVSYNNVSIDANVGLLVKNSQDTVRTVMNATEGISIYTKKDPSVAIYDKVFYVDTNGRLTTEKLVAKALEILDSNGRKIIDANEGVLNLNNLNRIEGQEKLNKITIGAETIFESGYNPKTLGTLYLIDSPQWDTAGTFVYHYGAGFGLHLRAYGDLNIYSCKMHSSGLNSGTIVLIRKDTGETVKSIDISLTDGENIVILDMALNADVGAYWLGTPNGWSGAGVTRNNNTVTAFPYNAGDFVIEDGGMIDYSSGSGFYYYFYDMLATGKGVRGYVANDKTLEAIRVKGTTLINGAFIKTGTMTADQIVIKDYLRVTNDENVETFAVDAGGNVTIRGNIWMEGGSITWGLDPTNTNYIRGFAWAEGDDGVWRLYLNADHIITGTFSFDRGHGGTLTLGGQELTETDENGQTLYSNGVLSVYSSNPQSGEIARLDGDYGGFRQLRIDTLLNTENVVFSTTARDPNLESDGVFRYYVDPNNGNDSVTTAGTTDDPYQSIQFVINILPKYLTADVRILVLPTILSDTSIIFEGFIGTGRVYIDVWQPKVRYIRDWLNGNTKNTGNHWVEIEAWTDNTNKISGLSEKEVEVKYLEDVKADMKANPMTINGVQVGLYTGTFTLNQSVDGTPNPGEIIIDMTDGNIVYESDGSKWYPASSPAKQEISTQFEDATNARTGYIMYVGSDKARFTLSYSVNTDSFVVAIYENGVWKYDDNFKYVEFTPNENDVIIARIGRSASTVSGIDIFERYYETFRRVEHIGRIVDGNRDSSSYFEGSTPDDSPNYVQVYLKGLYDLSHINVFHYYDDGRSYYGTKTEVSEDLNKWYTLYDSAIHETYAELSTGKKHFMNKARLNGYIHCKHNTVELNIQNLFINASGTGQTAVYAFATPYCRLYGSTVTGDRNVAYAVYCSGGANMRVSSSEINYAKTAGIAAAYGGRIEVTHAVGAGYPYGLYAHSSGLIGGSGDGPLGDTANTTKASGGFLSGSWNHKGGTYSPVTVDPTPPPPTIVTRTKTWTSTAGDSWNYGTGGWHTAEDDVLQGKYSSWGPYKGMWWFSSDMRNTCLNAVEIKKIRVYITRLNSSGYSSAVPHYIRTHGSASKGSSEPSYHSGYVTVSLARGNSAWVDITSTFKTLFGKGSVYGIGLWASSPANSNYTRCSNVAKIEVTYTEES